MLKVLTELSDITVKHSDEISVGSHNIEYAQLMCGKIMLTPTNLVNVVPVESDTKLNITGRAILASF